MAAVTAAPNTLPILAALKALLPDNDAKYFFWTQLFARIEVETVGDLRAIPDQVYESLKLPEVVKGAANSLRSVKLVYAGCNLCHCQKFVPGPIKHHSCAKCLHIHPPPTVEPRVAEEKKDISASSVAAHVTLWLPPPLSADDTRITMCHLVLSDDIGSMNASSVGFLLRLMDICACGSAEKLSGKPSVTLSMDDLIFSKALSKLVQPGRLVIARSQVNCAFNTSMEVGATCSVEDLVTGEKSWLCRAYFTFVALGPDKKKTNIPELTPGNEKNSVRLMMAKERREIRLRRKDIINAGAHDDLADTPDNITQATSKTTKPPPPPGSCDIEFTEIVLPPHANHMGNTFGGQIMSWMDKAATIVCSRYVQGAKTEPARLSLASIDDVFFVGPSFVGDRVLISAKPTRSFSHHSLEIAVVVVAFSHDGTKRGAINHAFWLYEQEGEACIPEVACETSEQKTAYGEALGRRTLRMDRYALGGTRKSVLALPWVPSLVPEISKTNIQCLLSIFSGGTAWETAPISKVYADNYSLYVKFEDVYLCAKLITTFPDCWPEDVLETLLDITQRSVWDHHYFISADIIEQIDSQNDVGRWVFKVDKQAPIHDFALLRSWRSSPERCIVASRSVLHPGVPETKGCPRGEVLSSGWVLDNIGNNDRGKEEPPICQVVYILQLPRQTASLALSTLSGKSTELFQNHDRLRAFMTEKATQRARERELQRQLFERDVKDLDDVIDLSHLAPDGSSS